MIAPLVRSFLATELNYNEGWNVRNAMRVAAGQPLYPEKYAWTSVNYPMLSFVAIAKLHRLTHDYLFTARVLSWIALLTGCFLVGSIIQRLTASRRAAVLTALFTCALFCASADGYVGVDDPQIAAQAFFLAGLYTYIRFRASMPGLAVTALLFAIGGFTKQNLIDFPLAVLIDLALLSWRRALWFSFVGIVSIFAGVLLHIHFGGPHFIDQLLAPRQYSWANAVTQLWEFFGPLLVPSVVAICMAVRVCRSPERRIVAILLTLSLLIGGYFGGGKGVSINSLFDALLATAMLSGLVFAEKWGQSLFLLRTARYFPVALFAWLLIPLAISGNLFPWRALRRSVDEEHTFKRNADFLRAHPGPALCESILLCYTAGKPYLYDPFNATRLITLHKLDAAPLLTAIEQQHFSTVQFSGPISDGLRRERFAPEVLAAVERYYRPAMRDGDSAIYVPVIQALPAP